MNYQNEKSSSIVKIKAMKNAKRLKRGKFLTVKSFLKRSESSNCFDGKFIFRDL